MALPNPETCVFRIIPKLFLTLKRTNNLLNFRAILRIMSSILGITIVNSFPINKARGMLGFECRATFTTHVCMRARVILVEAQKLETSKGRRAHRRMKSEKKNAF